ncbi:LAME_0C02410g1_1 [Lachancea meyersii CBS 8951]|uniref:LAME_0C02410g1_1 n=1 Tax=Lachancea meyersii CBS 8951 TaxID=1266667 RepID=A0A1G4J035_9SACH|nr:LAME_0C02410g1_1 [Lachancea meyersii CBS 8951]
MSTKNGIRSSVSSPSTFKNLVNKNESVLKVWVKLDTPFLAPDMANQATAIEYNKSDTVDDLKDRIFAKFKNTRWALENDNFGIGIGILCPCGPENGALQTQHPQLQDSRASGSRRELPRDLLMHPVPTSSAINNVRPNLASNASKSWQTSRTCSPYATSLDSPLSAQGSKLQVCSPTLTPVAPLRRATNHSAAGAAEPCSLSPVKRGLASRLSPNLGSTSGLAAKPDDLPRSAVHRSILEPDELVIDVCMTLFGGTATQKPADALLVFSNAREMPVFSDINDTIDEQEPLMEDMADYQLIVDEEQLRKLSLSNDEDSTDHKQAILLLPRGYEGDVNLPSPNMTSPSSTIDTHGAFGFESPTLKSAQLVEEEVGLVPSRDPVVQKEGSPFLRTALGAVTTDSITIDKVFPKINVLVVEDNMINQAILSSFLRKHKISYKTAKNGIEAVEKWEEGGMHLILMDLGLPLLSGIDAAKEIRKLEKIYGIGTQNLHSKTDCDQSSQNDKNLEPRRSHRSKAPVIIVALTASNSHSDKTEALLAGCNDYLTKPVNLDWLARKITEWGCMQALIDFNDWKEGNDHIPSCDDGVTKPRSSSNLSDTIRKSSSPET